jgi:hypothetical protein
MVLFVVAFAASFSILAPVCCFLKLVTLVVSFLSEVQFFRFS